MSQRSSLFPRHLWRKPRTAVVIERCLMNVESPEHIVYVMFNGLNGQRRNRTFRTFTQAA
jgi:hypothetical protein